MKTRFPSILSKRENLRWGERPREPLGFLCILGACSILLAAPSLRAQPSLQQILKDTAVGAHWIYDDFAKGVTEAKATSKPLMVTLRCVP